MKLSPFYQFLLLAFVTLGVYYPTLFAPFNSLDDQIFVNHLLDQLLNQKGISLTRHFSPGGTYDYYRPLVSLSFEIDKYVGGLQETFMHLVNVLLHLLNVLLLWLVARRFGLFVNTTSQWLPLLAALLFAMHPINTEAVNWIAGRTDLLAATFVLLSCYALLKSVERRSFFFAGVSALTLLAGALCKETALFFIPAACFLLICRKGHSPLTWRFRWTLPALYGMAAAGYFSLRWGAFQSDRGLGHTAKLVSQAFGSTVPIEAAVSSEAINSFPWLDAGTAALKASGFYAVKLFQPLPLNFAIHRVDDLYLIPGIVLIVGLLLLALQRNLTGWLFLASASIAISALMVLFTGLAWTPIAERYMYIPCGFFVIGLIYAVGPRLELATLKRVAPMLVFLLLGIAGWATSARNIVWQDNLTLYQDAVRQSPDFAPARNQLALALKAHNRDNEAMDIVVSNKSANEKATALNNAMALTEQGDYVAARAKLLQLAENERGYQETKILDLLIKLTHQYLKDVDDSDLRRVCYKDMLGWLERIKINNPSAFNNYRIGRIHLLLENKSAAQQAFAEAARLFPVDSIYKEPAAKLATELAQ